MARFLGVTPPAATKMLDRLERRGLVGRGASGDDRRVTLLNASPKGEETLAHYERREREQLALALHDFTGPELAELTRLLESYALALIRTSGDPAHCLRCAGWFDDQCAVQQMQSTCPYQDSRQEV